mmetsp:Transcript_7525/g.21306  ORF Transcript_7525/g.21306 Transcript_7525/m.21306 type:complete len:303 (+) Transcript_7525:1982-2890(+)
MNSVMAAALTQPRGRPRPPPRSSPAMGGIALRAPCALPPAAGKGHSAPAGMAGRCRSRCHLRRRRNRVLQCQRLLGRRPRSGWGRAWQRHWRSTRQARQCTSRRPHPRCLRNRVQLRQEHARSLPRSLSRYYHRCRRRCCCCQAEIPLQNQEGLQERPWELRQAEAGRRRRRLRLRVRLRGRRRRRHRQRQDPAHLPNLGGRRPSATAAPWRSETTWTACPQSQGCCLQRLHHRCCCRRRLDGLPLARSGGCGRQGRQTPQRSGMRGVRRDAAHLLALLPAAKGGWRRRKRRSALRVECTAR